MSDRLVDWLVPDTGVVSVVVIGNKPEFSVLILSFESGERTSSEPILESPSRVLLNVVVVISTVLATELNCGVVVAAAVVVVVAVVTD